MQKNKHPFKYKFTRPNDERTGLYIMLLSSDDQLTLMDDLIEEMDLSVT